MIRCLSTSHFVELLDAVVYRFLLVLLDVGFTPLFQKAARSDFFVTDIVQVIHDDFQIFGERSRNPDSRCRGFFLSRHIEKSTFHFVTRNTKAVGVSNCNSIKRFCKVYS